MTCETHTSVCVEGRVEGAVGIWKVRNKELIGVSHCMERNVFRESNKELKIATLLELLIV